MRASSAADALASAESLIAERVNIALESDTGYAFPKENAFGGELLVEKSGSFSQLVLSAKDAAESGLRVALIGSASEVIASRRALRALTLSRLGVVVHVLADASAMRGAVYSLLDLGFGLLFSSGPQDSFDLSFIARRAAEDAGIPFFVVHEHGAMSSLEALAAVDAPRLSSYVGAPRARLVKLSDPSHPVFVSAGERTFGKRSGFALSAAMRELEEVSGRRHDVIERAGPEGGLMLCGLGIVGDYVLGIAERSRDLAQPIGALKITALRPLDGPRIVKALARAHHVTVIEAGFDPLTETMPLARELKAAFADAITWAPGYPGVGRVPRFSSAVVGQHGLTERDIRAAVANMGDGDAAIRSFVFGEEDAPRAGAAASAEPSAGSPRLRVSCTEEASAVKVAKYILSAVSSAVGFKARVMLRGGDDGAVCVDVVSSREVARAEPERQAFDWVLPQQGELAATAALGAAFIAHGHRVIVDGPGIARAIALASGLTADETHARTAVESGRWRTRAE